MKRIGLLNFAYLALLSHPAKDRSLYRAIRRRRVASIVEIGVGQGVRSQRMIAAASRAHEPADICFAGLDLFEARPSHTAALTLKRAHRLLTACGAQVRLVPGDPCSSLARTANSLTGTDLIVISADQELDSLEAAWFYFPRMLHAGSLVLREGPHGYQEISRDEIQRRAEQSEAARRRAG